MEVEYVHNESIKDEANHTSAIEKIHYCPKNDKVVLYAAQSNKISVYNAADMKYQRSMSFECSGVVLAIEFIYTPTKDAMAVSLSDRTIAFYELTKSAVKGFIGPGNEPGIL